MRHQALDAAQRLRQREHLNRFDESPDRGGAAGQFETQHRTEPGLLHLRQSVTRMRWQAGIMHRADQRMRLEEFRNRAGIGLLPLDAQWQQGLAKVGWPTGNLPEIMSGDIATLRTLIREYLFISLFRACAESLASENASRLAAMERADKNITDLLEHLHGTFHRLRQTGIDEELFDVIAGFEALAGQR